MNTLILLLLVICYEITYVSSNELVLDLPSKTTPNVGKNWQLRINSVALNQRKEGRCLTCIAESIQNLIFGYCPTFLATIVNIVKWKIKVIMSILQAHQQWIVQIQDQIQSGGMTICSIFIALLQCIRDDIATGDVEEECNDDIINDLEVDLNKYDAKHKDEYVEVEPHLASLVVALQIPKARSIMTTHHEYLVNLLSRQGLYREIQDDLHVTKNTSTGALLKQIIDLALKKNITVKQGELKALKYYQNRILNDDVAALPVEWVPRYTNLGSKRKTIDVAETIDLALNNENLDLTVVSDVLAVFNFLKNHSDVITKWEDWEEYETAGMFTKALLERVAHYPNTSANVAKASAELIPYVSFHGNGAEPVAIIDQDGTYF